MKNVLITGSSNGFGYLAAQTLSRHGFKVWATMRDSNGRNQPKKQALEKMAADENLSLKVIDLDVSSDSSIQNAIQSITSEDKKIDVLINNAGVMYVGITEAYSIEQAQKQFDVNFFGVMRTTKAVLPFMRKAEDGLIINTTSLAGRLAFPYFGLYSASKSAVEAYSQALRYELAPFGVDICIVEPGPFGTNLLYSGPKEEGVSTLNEYGDFKDVPSAMLKNFEGFYQSDDALSPQLIADEYLRIIQLPKGERPTRTVSGIDYGTINYNELTQPIQDALVKDALGMGHLLTTKSIILYANQELN